MGIFMKDESDIEKGIRLKNLDWKFLRYFRTYGYLVQVEPRKREVVVFIPKNEVMFIADVSFYVNIDRLRVDRIYEMTFAIYVSKASSMLKRRLLEELKTPYLYDKSKYRREYHISKMKSLEDVFENVNVVYRFELLRASDWFYSSLIKDRFEYAVLKSYKAPTKFKWRHILGF